MTSKINKQYEDKIESYYELCRKKLGDQQAVQKHSGRDHQDGKFMRSNGGKVKGMGLDEAIKLLTLDWMIFTFLYILVLSYPIRKHEERGKCGN